MVGKPRKKITKEEEEDPRTRFVEFPRLLDSFDTAQSAVSAAKEHLGTAAEEARKAKAYEVADRIEAAMYEAIDFIKKLRGLAKEIMPKEEKQVSNLNRLLEQLEDEDDSDEQPSTQEYVEGYVKDMWEKLDDIRDDLSQIESFIPDDKKKQVEDVRYTLGNVTNALDDLRFI